MWEIKLRAFSAYFSDNSNHSSLPRRFVVSMAVLTVHLDSAWGSHIRGLLCPLAAGTGYFLALHLEVHSWEPARRSRLQTETWFNWRLIFFTFYFLHNYVFHSKFTNFLFTQHDLQLAWTFLICQLKTLVEVKIARWIKEHMFHAWLFIARRENILTRKPKPKNQQRFGGISCTCMTTIVPSSILLHIQQIAAPMGGRSGEGTIEVKNIFAEMHCGRSKMTWWHRVGVVLGDSQDHSRWQCG